MTTCKGNWSNTWKPLYNVPLSTIKLTETTSKMSLALQAQASMGTVRLTNTQLSISSPPVWKPNVYSTFIGTPITSYHGPIESCLHNHTPLVWNPLYYHCPKWSLLSVFGIEFCNHFSSFFDAQNQSHLFFLDLSHPSQ
jgi:hypothetical protein